MTTPTRELVNITFEDGVLRVDDGPGRARLQQLEEENQRLRDLVSRAIFYVGEYHDLIHDNDANDLATEMTNEIARSALSPPEAK